MFVIFSDSTVLQPTYTISKKGNYCLTHNGFVFIKGANTYRFGDKTHWRCSYSKENRYVCLAKGYTMKENGIEIATFKGTHCHKPTF